MEPSKEEEIIQGPHGEIILPIEGALELIHFYKMFTKLGDEKPLALMNPLDLRDLYLWEVEVTGYAFHERLKDNNRVVTLGEITIHSSVLIPKGTVIVNIDNQVGFIVKNYNEVKNDTSK